MRIISIRLSNIIGLFKVNLKLIKLLSSSDYSYRIIIKCETGMMEGWKPLEPQFLGVILASAYQVLASYASLMLRSSTMCLVPK